MGGGEGEWYGWGVMGWENGVGWGRAVLEQSRLMGCA